MASVEEDQDLTKVRLETLAGRAQVLARHGRITGEAALCMVIWPKRQDMIRYIKRQRRRAERLAA